MSARMARVEGKTIAEAFPARVDSNGVTWYRCGAGRMDGWTAQDEYADPSYFTADAPDPIESFKDGGDLWSFIGNQLAEGYTQSLEDISADVSERLGPTGYCVNGKHARCPHRPGGPCANGITTSDGEFYHCPCDCHRTTNREETPPVTALLEDGTTGPRVTEWMAFPLPPALPREEPPVNQYNHYKIPHPDTGKQATFPRATTIAKTLADRWNLEQWGLRQKAIALLKLIDLANDDFDGEYPVDPELGEIRNIEARSILAKIREYLFNDDKGKANDRLDYIDNLFGGAEAREFGEAVHAWLGAWDFGSVTWDQIPEQFRHHAKVYRDLLRKRGWIAVPQWVERLVLNDTALDEDEVPGGGEWVVGTLDRIYYDIASGFFILGDLKTSKAGSLEFSKLEFSAQFSVYGRARKMLAPNGREWEDMPLLLEDYAGCVHLPSDHPEQAAIITYSLSKGTECLNLSHQVRRVRKEVKSQVTAVYSLPTPTAESVRYAEAWFALSDITSVDELDAVWEKFQDVWDDDLTERGKTVAFHLEEGENRG